MNVDCSDSRDSRIEHSRLAKESTRNNHQVWNTQCRDGNRWVWIGFVNKYHVALAVTVIVLLLVVPQHSELILLVINELVEMSVFIMIKGFSTY